MSQACKPQSTYERPVAHDTMSAQADLGTIERHLRSFEYATPQAFLDDVRRVFANARRYNPRMSSVCRCERGLL